MDSNWAAEHLQTIRTLMERSAVYRRALAPVTTFVGLVGLMAAVGGWMLNINSEKAFAIYWMAICLVVIGGAFFLVRKQALKNAEPFWSPPTRRKYLAFRWVAHYFLDPALWACPACGGILHASGDTSVWLGSVGGRRP